MLCEWNGKLNALHDGELHGDARVAVEAHMAACVECAIEMQRLTRTARFLKAALMPAMNPLAMARLRERINGSRTIRLANWLTAAAAVVLLTCGAALYSTQSLPQHRGPMVAVVAADETTFVLNNAVLPGSELVTAAETSDPMALAVSHADLARDDGRE
jgi:anti-sigma factor RsiW